MADFTAIPNTSLEPKAPARSIDALALRDNPIAIAEGAPGAPRISDPAVAPGAIDIEKGVTVEAGAVIRYKNDLVRNSGPADQGFNLAYSGRLGNNGNTLSIEFEHRRRTGAGTSVVRLSLDDTTVQEWNISTQTFTFETTDFSFGMGQLIKLEHKIINAVTSDDGSEIRNIKLRTSGRALMPFKDGYQ